MHAKFVVGSDGELGTAHRASPLLNVMTAIFCQVRTRGYARRSILQWMATKQVSRSQCLHADLLTELSRGH